MKELFEKVCFCWLAMFPMCLSAQEKSFAQDTLAFRTYLNGNIGTAVKISTYMKVYRRLSASHTPEVRDRVYRILPVDRSGNLTNLFSTRNEYIVYHSATDFDPHTGKRWHVDNVRFPDTLRWALCDRINGYWKAHSRKEEKERLICALELFDSLSDSKPIFFADIHSKYNGDIARYVEALFSSSMLTKRGRLEKFCRHPTAKKLQSDPGVQFAIGLALYDLWIQKVRSGEITEGGDSLVEVSACE